jgi:Calpain family cysteine protease
MAWNPRAGSVWETLQKILRCLLMVLGVETWYKVCDVVLFIDDVVDVCLLFVSSFLSSFFSSHNTWFVVFLSFVFTCIGELGNCWALGAMSVVACRNDLLYPLFVCAHPEYGMYQIKFYKNGHWRVVTVDDYVPLKWFVVFCSCLFDEMVEVLMK